jgi:hypothetical protein
MSALPERGRSVPHRDRWTRRNGHDELWQAASSLLRTTLVRAADTARKQDPQLARIYYVQMIERGKNHLGALGTERFPGGPSRDCHPNQPRRAGRLLAKAGL